MELDYVHEFYAQLMDCFLDTSSLVKLYDPSEPDALTLQQEVAGAGLIYLSTLAQVEFTGALSRKRNRQELSFIAAQQLQRRFAADEPLYGWVEQTPALRQVAIQLLEKYTSLRTLDAIQLAAALAVRYSIQALFTHDRRLRDAAAAEKLPVR